MVIREVLRIVAGELQPVMMGCETGVDFGPYMQWPGFSVLGRRRIPPSLATVIYKLTTIPLKWQNWNSNPLQVLLWPFPQFLWIVRLRACRYCCHHLQDVDLGNPLRTRELPNIETISP